MADLSLSILRFLLVPPLLTYGNKQEPRDLKKKNFY